MAKLFSFGSGLRVGLDVQVADGFSMGLDEAFTGWHATAHQHIEGMIC